jgi:hypothetical protein
MRRAGPLREIARILQDYNARHGLSTYKYHAPRKRTSCVFCGGTPVNGEHIWPVWSHPYPPKGKKKWYSMNAKSYETITHFNVTKTPRAPHDQQVHCVDEACNNGWMREIENSVHPIISKMFESPPGTVRLTEADQNIVALWIGLKAIVSEYAPYRDRISHHTYRRQIWKKQKLPAKTWKIWIGSYTGRRASTLWMNSPHLLLPEKVAKKRRTRIANYFNGETITYVFGEMMIHVMRCPYEFAIKTWRFPPSVSYKLRQIWPPTGLSFIWPPQSLSDTEVHLISRCFNEFLKEAKAAHSAAKFG